MEGEGSLVAKEGCGRVEWPILQPWAVIRIEFSGQLDRKRDDESNFRTRCAAGWSRDKENEAARGVEREIYSATFHYMYLRPSVYHCVYRQESGERSALIEIANPGTGY